jgi:metal-sulfur cluster biosynthetic enzyme
VSDVGKRKTDVARVLNTITDPCSAAAGVPIGLVDMGIVESIDIDGDTVKIKVLPTFPGCVYIAIFSNEIRNKLAELDWTSDVTIDLEAQGSVWDEDRMSPSARTRLHQARAQRRRRARALRES